MLPSLSYCHSLPIVGYLCHVRWWSIGMLPRCMPTIPRIEPHPPIHTCAVPHVLHAGVSRQCHSSGTMGQALLHEGCDHVEVRIAHITYRR